MPEDTITISKSSIKMYAGIFLITLVASAIIGAMNPGSALSLPTTGAIVAGPIEYPTSFNVDIRNSEYIPTSITVNKGKTISLTINNRDSGLTHGVFQPKFGLSDHVPPLQSNTFTFVANEAGNEYTSCNPGLDEHSEKLEIIVV